MVIHGVPDLSTPEEHEWWCPFGMQVEVVGGAVTQEQLGAFQAALASANANAGASRKSSAASRKSSYCKGGREGGRVRISLSS